MYKYNYYELLEINRNDLSALSQEEISKLIGTAYLSQIKKYHPDRNPGFQKEANEKSIALNEAKEVLSDPIKRMNYDRSLEDRKRAAAQAGAWTEIIPDENRFKSVQTFGKLKGFTVVLSIAVMALVSLYFMIQLFGD